MVGGTNGGGFALTPLTAVAPTLPGLAVVDDAAEDEGVEEVDRSDKD